MNYNFLSGLERTVRKFGTISTAIAISAIVSGPACGDIESPLSPTQTAQTKNIPPSSSGQSPKKENKKEIKVHGYTLGETYIPLEYKVEPEQYKQPNDGLAAAVVKIVEALSSRYGAAPDKFDPKNLDINYTILLKKDDNVESLGQGLYGAWTRNSPNPSHMLVSSDVFKRDSVHLLIFQDPNGKNLYLFQVAEKGLDSSVSGPNKQFVRLFSTGYYDTATGTFVVQDFKPSSGQNRK